MADPYQDWYRKWAEKTGINPDPDDPRHFYDYRAAYDAGDEPTLGEDGYHWPSKYKREGHPNMVVDGVNTKTGAQEETLGQNALRTVGTLGGLTTMLTPTPTSPSFGGGSSSGAGAGSDWGLTDVDIEEMIRNKPTLEESPVIHPGDLGQRMPSPEFQHEAKKDFLKAAATEVAGNAALGGVGKAASFLPMTNLQAFKQALDKAKWNAPIVGGSARYDRMVAKANAAVPEEIKDKIRATMTREQGAPVYRSGEPIEGTFWEIFPVEGNQQAQALYDRAVRLGHVKDGKAYYGEF